MLLTNFLSELPARPLYLNVVQQSDGERDSTKLSPSEHLPDLPAVNPFPPGPDPILEQTCMVLSVRPVVMGPFLVDWVGQFGLVSYVSQNALTHQKKTCNGKSLVGRVDSILFRFNSL